MLRSTQHLTNNIFVAREFDKAESTSTRQNLYPRNRFRPSHGPPYHYLKRYSKLTSNTVQIHRCNCKRTRKLQDASYSTVQYVQAARSSEYVSLFSKRYSTVSQGYFNLQYDTSAWVGNKASSRGSVRITRSLVSPPWNLKKQFEHPFQSHEVFSQRSFLLLLDVKKREDQSCRIHVLLTFSYKASKKPSEENNYVTTGVKAQCEGSNQLYIFSIYTVN